MNRVLEKHTTFRPYKRRECPLLDDGAEEEAAGKSSTAMHGPKAPQPGCTRLQSRKVILICGTRMEAVGVAVVVVSLWVLVLFVLVLVAVLLFMEVLALS